MSAENFLYVHLVWCSIEAIFFAMLLWKYFYDQWKLTQTPESPETSTEHIKQTWVWPKFLISMICCFLWSILFFQYSKAGWLYWIFLLFHMPIPVLIVFTIVPGLKQLIIRIAGIIIPIFNAFLGWILLRSQTKKIKYEDIKQDKTPAKYKYQTWWEKNFNKKLGFAGDQL